MKKSYELVQIHGVFCPKNTIDYRSTLESYTWLNPLQETTEPTFQSLEYGNLFSPGFFDDCTGEVLKFTKSNWGFQTTCINTGAPSYLHMFRNINPYIAEICAHIQTIVDGRRMHTPSPTLVTFLTIWSVTTESDDLPLKLEGFFNSDMLPDCIVPQLEYDPVLYEQPMICGRLAQIMASFRRTNETD